MAMIAAAAIPAVIGAVSSYMGNKAAAKQAEKARQDALAWRKEVTTAAQPFLTGSTNAYNLLGNALGLGGQEGIQSYLSASLNPLLAGAQSNAVDALNQKYAAMGYGPMDGNKIASANRLLQDMYLNQYNTGVNNLNSMAQGMGNIGSNFYGTASNALNASTTAGLTQGQYNGQAIGGAGNYLMQGASGVLNSPQVQNYLNSK